MPDERLGSLIRAARETRGLSQDTAAADALHKTGARLGQFEQGRSIPAIDEVVRLHHLLFSGSRERRAASLLTWIAAWIDEHKRDRLPNLREEHEEALNSALELLARLVPKTADGRAAPAHSLADFPDAFLPLQIVVGDRREVSRPRITMADLFTLSFASSDLMFLSDVLLEHPAFLREPPPVWSDKVTVLMPRSYLETKIGGSNLLIIGSPAVNWAARIANSSALFRFDIDPGWREWDEKYRSQQKLANDRTCQLFYRICSAVEDTAGRADAEEIEKYVAPTEAQRQDFQAALDIAKELLGQPGSMIEPKNITYAYRQHGLLDPADRMIQATYTGPTNDFGAISLGPNPWAPRGSGHVAILVGGIHGPGTAHGVRLLSQPGEFASRPFGGVFEVELGGLFPAWPDRFRDARTTWQTRDYTPEQLLQNLTTGLEQHGTTNPGWLKRYSEEDLRADVEFVSALLRAPVSI